MKGFTLVEMMVALLIFGMLASAGVMVMRSSIDSQMAVRSRVDTIGGFQRLRATLKADIGQAAQRRTRGPDGTINPAFVGGAQTSRPLLALVRRGWENPDAQSRASLQYVEYRVIDGRLERRVRSGLDGGALSAPQVLAEGLEGAAIAFYAREQWRPDWDGSEPLPEAVRLELTLAGLGPVTQLFATPAAGR
jgi:general secretion pathway protein J